LISLTCRASKECSCGAATGRAAECCSGSCAIAVVCALPGAAVKTASYRVAVGVKTAGIRW
jgi:hypothetical protein